MELFKCKLLDKNGNIIEQYVVAKSYDELAKSSYDHNTIFISAKKQGSNLKFPYKDFTIPFLRNLSQLVTNKFNLVISLEITAKMFHDTESLLIIDYIINDIKQGLAFSKALSKFDKYFDDFTIKTIEISEKTARLPEALINIIEYLESNFKIQQKIKSAIKYPLMLLTCVSFVFLFWIFVIVPKFAELFSEMGVYIPFYTKIVIRFSNFLINNVLYISLFLLIFIIIVMKYVKLSGILSKVPVIFKIKQNLKILNFFNAMNIMIKEKVNLIDSLQSLENRYPNVKDIIKFIEGGNSFSTSLMKSKMFSDLDISIIETAEKSGNLSSAFQTIIVIAQNCIDNKLNEIIKLIPTLAVCFIGILLIIIVCSLVIPMYSGLDLYV